MKKLIVFGIVCSLVNSSFAASDQSPRASLLRRQSSQEARPANQVKKKTEKPVSQEKKASDNGDDSVYWAVKAYCELAVFPFYPQK